MSDTFWFLRRNNADVVMPEMMCNNCIGRVSPIRQTVVQHHRTIIGILYNNISPLGSISLYFIIDGLRLLPARHWIREGSPIAFPLEVSLRIEAVGEAGAHCGGRADELHHHRAPALLRWLLDFTGKCRNWPCKQFKLSSSSSSSTTSTNLLCGGAKEPGAPAISSCGRVCHISVLLRALWLA